MNQSLLTHLDHTPVDVPCTEDEEVRYSCLRGAHACSVLVFAFCENELPAAVIAAIAQLDEQQKLVSAECRNKHAWRRALPERGEPADSGWRSSPFDLRKSTARLVAIVCRLKVAGMALDQRFEDGEAGTVMFGRMRLIAT